jgi:hypothetical protein
VRLPGGPRSIALPPVTGQEEVSTQGTAAGRTLRAFSSKLREETDLNRLGGELVSVVRETMQPEHASLWLRLPGRRERYESEVEDV